MVVLIGLKWNHMEHTIYKTIFKGTYSQNMGVSFLVLSNEVVDPVSDDEDGINHEVAAAILGKVT